MAASAGNQAEKRIDPNHFKMFQWFDRVGTHVDISAVRRELPGLHSFERWLQTTWRTKVPAEFELLSRE